MKSSNSFLQNVPGMANAAVAEEVAKMLLPSLTSSKLMHIHIMTQIPFLSSTSCCQINAKPSLLVWPLLESSSLEHKTLAKGVLKLKSRARAAAGGGGNRHSSSFYDQQLDFIDLS